MVYSLQLVPGCPLPTNSSQTSSPTNVSTHVLGVSCPVGVFRHVGDPDLPSPRSRSPYTSFTTVDLGTLSPAPTLDTGPLLLSSRRFWFRPSFLRPVYETGGHEDGYGDTRLRLIFGLLFRHPFQLPSLVGSPVSRPSSFHLPPRPPVSGRVHLKDPEAKD